VPLADSVDLFSCDPHAPLYIAATPYMHDAPSPAAAIQYSLFSKSHGRYRNGWSGHVNNDRRLIIIVLSTIVGLSEWRRRVLLLPPSASTGPSYPVPVLTPSDLTVLCILHLKAAPNTITLCYKLTTSPSPPLPPRR